MLQFKGMNGVAGFTKKLKIGSVALQLCNLAMPLVAKTFKFFSATSVNVINLDQFWFVASATNAGDCAVSNNQQCATAITSLPFS